MPATTSPLLDVACYRVLATYDSGDGVRGAVFNKVITLLNSRLLEHQFDINLPHNWYRFGDEVVPLELPRQIRFAPRDADIPRTTFRWEGEAPSLESIPEWKQRRIGDELARIKEEFGTQKVDLESIVDEVYDEAPFEFQKKYLSLRRRVEERQSWSLVSDVIPGIIMPSFLDMVPTFPVGDFPELGPLFKRYVRLAKFSLERGALQTFESLNQAFWYGFCYFLRIHPRGHFNVSQRRLDAWRDAANEYARSLGPTLTRIAEEMVADLGIQLDPWERAKFVGAHWGVPPSSSSTEVDSVVYR